MDRFDYPSGKAAEGPIVFHDSSRDMVTHSQQATPIHTEDSTETTTTGSGTVTVGFDYLKRLEDRITDLQLWAGPPSSRPPPPGTFMIQGRKAPKAVEGEASGEANGEKKLEIIRLKTVPTYHGEHDPKREPDEESAPGHTVTEASKPTLTVVRMFEMGNRFWRKKLEIVSPSLVDSLTHVSTYETDVEMVDGDLHLYEPFMVLFHNRQQLRSLAEDTAGSTPAKEPARLILDFMQSEFADISQKMDDVESQNPSGSITFPNIWMLYPPGTIVYSIENGEREAFVVESIRGAQRRRPGFIGRHSHTRLDVTCWSINYDGEIFGRVWSTHCILPFHGTKDISALDLVPERFLPEAESVKSALLVRGKQFWSLQGQKYLEYTGEMYSQQASNDEAVRVMVDHLSYQRRNNWPITIDRKRGPSAAQSKNWRSNRFTRSDRHGIPLPSVPPQRGLCQPVPHYGNFHQPVHPQGCFYQPANIDDPDELNNVASHRVFRTERPPIRDNSEFNRYNCLQPDSTPDELTLLLCPQQVHGYSLRDKVWKQLNVTQLRPVSFRKNAWDRLVLDAEYKDIVQAMVSSYVDKTAKLDDLVAGKGKGLVTLLHGPPGSGKTLTAECVADAFEKPLYLVTCGDIGTDPEGLEERLEEIFDYAVTFSAILLLDEADIFLQDRDYKNLERNALVSIFLRTLEYFQGVLFLTTNRVGMFDQAFQSRIHVSLGLPSLDQERRIAVWKIFLQDLQSKSAISDTQYDVLTKLVKEKWSKERLNGRQIRNAVRTALVVAEKKGEMVGEREFETVLRIGREFDGYMGALGKREGVERGALEGFMEVGRL